MSRCVKSSIKNWVDCRYPRARQKAPVSKFWGVMLNLPQLKRGFPSPHLLAAFSLYLISEQLAQSAVRSPQSAVHDSATARVVIDWDARPHEDPSPPGVSWRTFENEAVGQAVSFYVHLPPNYKDSGSNRYPVIYDLYGNWKTSFTSSTICSY